jgi:uncharacterized protein
MSSSSTVALPFTPNPGGALEPSQVVGRDELIAECWRALQVQSIALLAPRRIGKTSVLTRMAAEPRPGFVVVRRDLEGLESTAEFVHVLFDDVERLLGRWKGRAARAHAYLDKLAIETKHIKAQLRGPGWKRLLDRLFEDLEDQLAARDELLVLMWDEVTLFVGDLLRRQQADDAMALLDTLRAVRQRHAHVRMVLTGSIGFEEILRRLRRTHDYRNRPLNDVARVFVPLLDDAGAERLVVALLRHADKHHDPALVAAMVDRCEGHPFVIQLLANKLVTLPDPGVQDVDAHLHAMLRPPGDPLDLQYYVERIDEQFDGGQAAIARAALDLLASTRTGMSRAELLAALPHVDREQLLVTLRQLEDDFYLRREHDKLRFMLELLRRHWQQERPQ